LWEVFFVEKLRLEPKEAEAIACRFEHVTPEALAEQLATFLGNPTLSPQNEPIPAGDLAAVEHPSRSLTTLIVGERGQIAGIGTDDISKDFLRHQGIFPGVGVEVLAVAADGSLLLETSGRRLCLSRTIAGHIDVTATPNLETH
jgi:Fe2+ transport system protein FeoA